MLCCRFPTVLSPCAALGSSTTDCTGRRPLRRIIARDSRASPVAQIVVTGEDTVAMINQQAETTFGLSARDIGPRANIACITAFIEICRATGATPARPPGGKVLPFRE